MEIGVPSSPALTRAQEMDQGGDILGRTKRREG